MHTGNERMRTSSTVFAAGVLLLVGCTSHRDSAPEPAAETSRTTTVAPTADPTPVPTETDVPTGLPFDVTMTFEPTLSSSGQVTITAASNLPDGAELMTSLSSDAGYHAQAKSVLTDGTAAFGPFSDQGAGLPAGEYDLSISMSIAHLQTQSVREYIGVAGELMTGPLVVASTIEIGSYVSLDTILTVK